MFFCLIDTYGKLIDLGMSPCRRAFGNCFLVSCSFVLRRFRYHWSLARRVFFSSDMWSAWASSIFFRWTSHLNIIESLKSFPIFPHTYFTPRIQFYLRRSNHRISVNKHLGMFAKIAEEKNDYKIWQPNPRGILVKGNSSEVFQRLNSSNIRFYSRALGAVSDQ